MIISCSFIRAELGCARSQRRYKRGEDALCLLKWIGSRMNVYKYVHRALRVACTTIRVYIVGVMAGMNYYSTDTSFITGSNILFGIKELKQYNRSDRWRLIYTWLNIWAKSSYSSIHFIYIWCGDVTVMIKFRQYKSHPLAFHPERTGRVTLYMKTQSLHFIRNASDE
jgi:hypothetical protein